MSGPEVETDRRRALRALLAQPMISAAGETADEYALVRRHFKWLKEWFEKFPNWSLSINSEVARLRKIPADFLDDTRSAGDRTSGTTFTRRRYVLLCLVLASLEQLGRQTTLGQVARMVTEFVAADRELQRAGLVFDMGHHDQRRDLAHAIRLLMDLAVLSRIDGDERNFLDPNASGDVLYGINRHVLASILQVSRSASVVERTVQRSAGPSTLERATSFAGDPSPACDDGRSQWIRARLVRSLLDDPVLYFDNLNDEERHYLEKHRGYLLRQINEATGLVAEVRAEGIAMVDDAGDLTDLKLPGEGTSGRLNLLLVQWFSECFSSDAGAAIPLRAVEQHVRERIQVHDLECYREAGEPGSEVQLTEDALEQLRALRLIQLTADGVVPLAACGRYSRKGHTHQE